MLKDLQEVFSGTTTAAGVTTGDAITVTAISSNVIDLRNGSLALADEGVSGPEMWLMVQVTDNAFTAAGAATLTITLESDTAVGLGASPVVHYSTPAIGKATLVVGYTAVRVQIPSGDYKRYLGLRYTVATGPMTAGNVVAFITPDVQRNVIYPGSFTLDV